VISPWIGFANSVDSRGQFLKKLCFSYIRWCWLEYRFIYSVCKIDGNV